MPLTPLRRARLDRDFTQFDLAANAKISTGRMSMIDRGLVEPTPDEWKRLAVALGATVEEIAGRPVPLEAA